MASFTNFKVSWETRGCIVDGKPGYFHTWEQFSRPVGESPIKGGPPAGVISGVYGIVEFPDGVERVDPTYIKFCDEENANLCSLTEHLKENTNDQD